MRRSMMVIIPILLLFMSNIVLAQQKGFKRPEKLVDIPESIYRAGWALVIGINKYPYLPPQYQLEYAVPDADSVSKLIERRFGFEKDKIILLKDEEATKKNIMDSLSSLADPKKVQPEDCVLFYFSGHGQTITLPESGGGGKMGFLVTHDAEVDLSDQPNAAQYYRYCVGMDELNRAAKLIPARHVIFIVDACYSGLVLPSSRGLDPKLPGYLKKVWSVPAQQMITAGGQGEESMELPDLGHGLFTHKLLEGLDKGVADMDDDGIITGSELGMYLRSSVPKMQNAKQTPQFRTAGEGEFLFIPAQASEVKVNPPKPTKPAKEDTVEVVEQDTEAVVEEVNNTLKFSVDSEPKGASVQIDGQEMGKTPCSIETEFSGKDNCEVVISKDGYKTKRLRVKNLAAGKQVELKNIRLEQSKADVIAEPPRKPEITETESAPSKPAVNKNEITGKDGARMVLIPAGEYEMGSNDPNVDYGMNTARTVNLNAFYMDVYEVTNTQYRKFMDATSHAAPAYWNDSSLNAPDLPVAGVGWDDAVAYCQWAGKRLPTEAEWEKAARGDLKGNKYPWGNDISHNNANYYGTDGKDTWYSSAPVGKFEPNGYGLYDMAGNVWEWCADWYGDKYESVRDNPSGPGSGYSRVLRGGAWNLGQEYLYVAKRYARDPKSKYYNDQGFRCVMDAR